MFSNIDISGDYDKYYESIRKYEEHKISKSKEDEINEDIKYQNEAARVEETLQYKQIASELLEKDIAIDKLENKEYYAYDVDQFEEEDNQMRKEKEERIILQNEIDKLPFEEKPFELTSQQLQEINRLAEEFYQEELTKSK
jgi:hypothetical protein